MCAILVLSLAACDGDTPTRRDDDNTNQNSESDVTPTGEVTPGEPTPTGTAATTPTGTEPTTIATATPSAAATATPTAATTATPTAAATPTTAATPAATATPTTAATPTPTKAATATPTPLPLPDPLPDIEDFMYERPNKAIMAFADYLDYKARIEIDSETDLCFGLCFINSDETPELWWATGGSHADTVTVCMYDGKDVVELGSYGQFGSFTYMPRCHTIVSSYYGMGHYDDSVILLNGTEVFTAFEFEKIETGSGYVYYVNGAECSQKDYDDRYNAWQIDTYTTVEYPDGISIFDGEYHVSTTYKPLFNQYLSFYSANPFKYVIPEDVYETLLGTWTAETYLLEGNLYDCKERGDFHQWVFSKIGEQKVITGFVGDTVTYTPVNPKYIPQREKPADYALSLWTIEFDDPNLATFVYTLYMHADGTLYVAHWSGVEKSACTYALYRK